MSAVYTYCKVQALAATMSAFSTRQSEVFCVCYICPRLTTAKMNVDELWVWRPYRYRRGNVPFFASFMKELFLRLIAVRALAWM